jgi:hypothetical protein
MPLAPYATEVKACHAVSAAVGSLSPGVIARALMYDHHGTPCVIATCRNRAIFASHAAGDAGICHLFGTGAKLG